LAYNTIFEEVTQKTGGKQQSKSWYRSQMFFARTMKYEKNKKSLINAEKYDDVDEMGGRDQNIIRSFPRLFSLMFYEYRAKWRRDLPFYDKYPLTYILDFQPNYFFGVNLHYYSPEERVGIARSLAENKIPRFTKGAHKYLLTEVRSPFLDFDTREWDTVCLLPVEEFVRDLGGVEIPIPSDIVWGK
jgi:hypothetical protein